MNMSQQKISSSLHEQFTNNLNDIITTRNQLEAESPDWSKVSVYKLVSVVKDFAVTHFKSANRIFDRLIDLLRNHQEQINELNRKFSLLEESRQHG
ncbi:hypothetical protein VA7868_02939 [Vibrio aerogenes CECT 7868]|uniref:Uncharacterized protein n=2 Tax=Vibrio aerogenes TaxID=92172 RepID=A0A1M5ZMB3_9VIBR|nr:hypothetical protein VA7868_02939 [Vibrio aerogenes CECT 7868]